MKPSATYPIARRSLREPARRAPRCWGCVWLLMLMATAGCTSGDVARPSIFGLRRGNSAPNAAATAALTSAPLAEPNVTLPGAVPAGVVTAQTGAASNTAAARNEQLSQIMAELQTLGALDPVAQSQLLADLQQTDPALWPQMVQVFRASLKYRQRQKEQATTVANAAKPIDARPVVEATTATATVSATAVTPVAAPAPANQPPAAAPVQLAGTAPATNAPTVASPAATPAPATPSATSAAATSTAAAPDTTSSPITPVSFDRPLTPEDVPGMISQAIAKLEESTADGGTSPEVLAQQAQLRMMYLMAGRKKDAMRPIAGMQPAEQDFWVQQMYGMSTYLDAGQGRDRDRRLTDATTHLAQAVDRLAESSNLLVKNLAFCTEVSSFGVHTDFPKYEFKAGQQLLLYCELQNFKSEATPKGHRTSLKSSYQIVDAQGRRVAEHELPATEENCQNVRHDYFIRYFLHLPTKIYGGKYTLQLTVEDTLANKAGQASIEFTIKGE
ncbi:MAG: hypothetical protein JSS27_18545 [Planctomycetes bacterium]|nr:hypothetical protein [Planctomycetota bacterium]